ncbi:IS1595 family transposase [Sphingomonas sp. G124]|uniref:IS1595 family transposase n=1 Tax=Sphingomonas cremea TaxID=2904799 RepID=A0A9X1QKL9_9SPHN|nr:IS1595 family transposase [Sphingomonas cremea]MCF2513663.1 IS1595 family transposase [Sphingomonas cremea]
MTFDLTNPVFSDAEKAREYLESLHWPDGAVCPHCNLMNNTKVGGKTARPGLYMCNACRKQFTVTVGTIFEDSKIPLNKWLLAFRLINGGKKGISANEIKRHLGISYKSAWFMMHRIREAMQDDGSPLGGPGKVVESDEAIVGGFKRKRLSGKIAPKKKIVTLVERGGSARSFHITNITHKNVRHALVTSAHRSSVLMTDDARFYNNIGREFAEHHTTLHSNREFAKAGGIHSNTAENFFSIFKRGLVGTYHHMSAAHLHRYLVEFDFRYNTRKVSDAERTEEALKGARGKRLTYRQPSSLAA